MYGSRPYLQAFLDECIAAAEQCGVEGWEVVLINDRSPTDSLATRCNADRPKRASWWSTRLVFGNQDTHKGGWFEGSSVRGSGAALMR